MQRCLLPHMLTLPSFSIQFAAQLSELKMAIMQTETGMFVAEQDGV